MQIVKLNMEEKTAEVDEDALSCLVGRLQAVGPVAPVAVVSVMGAFRTGKSFLLDLFLRFLRHEERCGSTQGEGSAPPRAEGTAFPMPSWLTSAGSLLEGAGGSSGGFRSRGGMDTVTEGIWVWSEPFVRTVQDGEGTKKVVVILMDTQGAWDGTMTKEQSATVFGLTAVLSSKLIYNVNMQVQEDKVDNLGFFAGFARAALSKSAGAEQAVDGQRFSQEDVDRPFQSLDFLVRDWRHFRPEGSLEQCRQQMQLHIGKFIDPAKVRESSTAEALNSMFKNIACFCLPHPGLIIEKEAWSGNVNDLDQDFVRFADTYIREVFSTALEVKVVLGSELSTLSFPHVLQKFVTAFQDTAPHAMSFTEAMTCSTSLLAREQAMSMYRKTMEETLSRCRRGLEDTAFGIASRIAKDKAKADFNQATIFGGEDTRKETWEGIESSIERLRMEFHEQNKRLLERGLVAFAGIALLGSCLFLLDRASDFACDWWLQICVDLSRLMLLAYLGIFAYIAWQVYCLGSESGTVSVAHAVAEMWKEMMRLVVNYGEAARDVRLTDVPRLATNALRALFSSEKKSN